MQKFTEIDENESIENSRKLLLDNDKTALTNNAGIEFPSNPLEGMTCYRTDLQKKYTRIGSDWVDSIDKHNTDGLTHENGIAGNAATASALRPVLKGREKECWLLCKLPSHTTALVHYKILGAQHCDQYACLEVIVKNGFGWCRYVGRDTSCSASIRAYVTDEYIEVYLFIPDYCDSWEVHLVKYGAVSEFNYQKVGDEAYLPSGTLVLDTNTGLGCTGVDLFCGKQMVTKAEVDGRFGNAINKSPIYNNAGRLVFPNGATFWIG